MIEMEGVGVSHGIAFGQALVIGRWELDVPHYNIHQGDVRSELRRFLRARSRARAQIVALRDSIQARLGSKYAAIFDAHLMMLGDRKLGRETMTRISERLMNAEWALAAAVSGFLATLESVDDPYIRERGGDLADVHRRLQHVLAGEENRHDRQLALDEDTVVVAHALSPSDAAWLHQPHVVGFVTEEGSRTSHTAILAAALEIPAVLGIERVALTVSSGERVVVDGSRGRVIVDPDRQSLEAAREARAEQDRHDRQLESERGPTFTQDGVELRIAANIEFAEEMGTVGRVGADGVGLYRTEFLFLATSPRLPSEEDHYEAYRRVVEGAAGATVVIRTLDLGGEKYFHRVLRGREPNPVLGLRAVRLCLARPEIFRVQLRGLMRAAVGNPNVWMLVPMISGVDEWRAVRDFVVRVRDELVAEGVAVADVPIGPMIEVPSAALVVEHLAQEADFLSIGTNDLVQYLIAVDRNNSAVGYLGEPLHPAVLALLRRVLEAGANAGKPVSLCGEMASDPLGALTLLGLGLRWYSCSAVAIPEIRNLLRQASAREAQRAVAACLEMDSGSAVREHLSSRFGELVAATFGDGSRSRIGSGGPSGDRDGRQTDGES